MAGKNKYREVAKLCKMSLWMQQILNQNMNRSFFYVNWQANFTSLHGGQKCRKMLKIIIQNIQQASTMKTKWQYRQKAISGGNIDYPENKELAHPIRNHGNTT